MGLLSVFKKATPEEEIKAEGVDLATCDFDCGSCDNELPALLNLRHDDDNAALWKLTKPYDLHMLVSTGRSDWLHDACETEGTLEHAVEKWGGSPALEHKPKTSVLLFAPHNGEILLMPFFVWLKDVPVDRAHDALDKIVPELVKARAEGSVIEETADLLGDGSGVKVAIDHMKAYVILCSHRTRDKRCGVTAPLLKKEFELHIRDDGVYRDTGDNREGGIVVGFVNHLGQHKYAANVMVYRREDGEMIWLARAQPKNVQPIYNECVKAGRTFADHTRLVQKTKVIAW